MNNELVVSQNESNEAFIAKLNNAIGFTQGLPILPTLKFDAQAGKFLKSTGEKDEEGKPIYEELTEQIEFHILTTRKMVQTDYNSETFLYSREFQDSYVELFNENKQVVMKGFYKDLKANNPNLKFIQVLYVMYEGKPYRFKLAGSKLQNLFPYLSSFVNDSPALWLTVATKGQQLTNGAVKYFELLFERGEKITDQKLIVSRVNDINMYISLMNQARSSEFSQVDNPPTYQPEIEEPIETSNEISVDQIPM
ncbi:MAG: hypothetical protein JSS91_00890 [Bacteroidetes bacterium]|nr:hypothetical protein [Bacteroidota bacterium]